MAKFSIGDHIVDLTYGVRYTVIGLDFMIQANGFPYEEMRLERHPDGLKITVPRAYWHNYALVTSLPTGWTPANQNSSGVMPSSPPHPLGAPVNSGVFTVPHGIQFIPLEIKISGVGVAECDHEWVTWTGLRNTITDCTKCKKVKNG